VGVACTTRSRGRLARGLVAGERRHLRGLGGRHLGEKVVFGRRRLDLLELQLKLVDQAGGPFGRWAILLTLQLGDLELEMGDGRIGVGVASGGRCELGLGGQERSLQCIDVTGKLSAHGADRSTKR
jgi:hypothetical protein